MLRLALLSAAFATAACAQTPAGSQVDEVMTEAGPVAVYEMTDGLDHPWGITFLPDGRALVTERSGALRILDGTTLSDPVGGTPTVYAQGQGGLLDVALAPDFAETAEVYLTYAKPGPGGGAATAVGRGRFQGDSLAAFEELWVQTPFVTGPNHFGSRVAFLPDGTVAVSTGERFQFDPAQDLGNTLGVLVRINRDGSVPDDNPFVGDADVRPEIWSYGHRNVQSLAVHPETGDLWEAEFGPLGGDELNRVERGANYGWPTVSWGINYDRSPIPDPPTRPEFADAVRQWTPVISPSGMEFYTGTLLPEWTGSLMVSSLTRQGVVRLVVEGGAVTHEESIPLGSRVRDVAPGPDGSVYVVTDKGDGQVLAPGTTPGRVSARRPRLWPLTPSVPSPASLSPRPGRGLGHPRVVGVRPDRHDGRPRPRRRRGDARRRSRSCRAGRRSRWPSASAPRRSGPRTRPSRSTRSAVGCRACGSRTVATPPPASECWSAGSAGGPRSASAARTSCSTASR